MRPFTDADLGRRVRALWQGAEYRGRGRETIWLGKLELEGNRIARFAPVNFLNPERTIKEKAPATVLAWDPVTTGNLAGIDLWLDQASSGSHKIETNVVSAERRDRHQRYSGDDGAWDNAARDRHTHSASPWV